MVRLSRHFDEDVVTAPWCDAESGSRRDKARYGIRGVGSGCGGSGLAAKFGGMQDRKQSDLARARLMSTIMSMMVEKQCGP